MTNEPKRRGRPRKNPLPEQQVDVPEMSVTEPTSVQAPAVLKVHIYPPFAEKSVGGIPRVVEAQEKYLPQYGIEITSAEEADVIAYHVSPADQFVKKYPEKAFVSLIHGFYWSEYSWDRWSLKANADAIEGIRVSDAVATCSNWVANTIKRHTSRPVWVIPHGIDVDEWVGHDTIEYVLWNKFRADPVCDPTPMNEVAAKMPDVQFYSTMGKEAENVKIVGELPFDVSKQAVERAAVYLCTTRETFGIGTLEAMSCGVPVVGFNWGGQAEFIEHGVDGWLVTPGDIDGLAEGIRWALSNRKEISKKAREKASFFTWERACSAYADLFRSAFARKHRKSPRTSIIVTAYNLEKYLPDALESVLNQSDNDWECIIVNDSSPDRCGEIAESWASRDSRFRVIHNEQNEYLAEARNVGIRASNGHYILPLDADDMLPRDAVGTLADALDADRTIHVAYGSVFFINEDGAPTEYGMGPGKSSWPYPFAFEQQIQQRNLLPYSSMYRREAWENVGGYRRRCKTAEDADFWTRLSSYGYRPKMVVSEPTLIYRNREGSMSRTNSSDWIRWFTWSQVPELTPAGACTKEQLPISSLEPLQISVIIPVGPGHERIFSDAIDSVEIQTYRNWECIVVNDTGHALRETPSWVTVVETIGGTGVAHARNVGIQASHGKLFLPLDADDYLQSDALRLMYEAYRERHDVIYSDFWIDEGDGKPYLWEADNYDPFLLTGKKRIIGKETREGMTRSVVALTPKVLWHRVGGYDETLPAWEDWDFQLALGAIGACEQRVAVPLFTYRKDKGFRRLANYNSKQDSVSAFKKKWNELWEGGKQLMACGSCRARTSAAVQTPMMMSAKNNSGSDDAVLIVYNGEKLGNMTYRGPSKTTYIFSKGESRYVLAMDVPLFLDLDGFEVVQKVEEVSKEPVLTVD